MLIALHKQARTTPAVRAEIAASTEPVCVLARRHRKLPRQVDIPELESAAVVSLGMNCLGGRPPRAS